MVDDVGDFARPDSLGPNAGPTVQGTVFVSTWGEGYDPHAPAGARKTGLGKRSVGVNNRFSYGGVAAMSAYHDLYARMCHDGLAQAMPFGFNFEQMVHWLSLIHI